MTQAITGVSSKDYCKPEQKNSKPANQQSKREVPVIPAGAFVILRYVSLSGLYYMIG